MARIGPLKHIDYNARLFLNSNNYSISTTILEINKFIFFNYFGNFYLQYLNHQQNKTLVIAQRNNSIVIKSKVIYSSSFKIFYDSYFRSSFLNLYKLLYKKLQLGLLILGKITIYLIFNKIKIILLKKS